MADLSVTLHKPVLTKKDLENVLDSLIQDNLLTGNVSRLLESSLADTVQKKYALTFPSLASAFFSIWGSMAIEPGDEIILPSLYGPTIVSTLKLYQAKPVLVDFDREGFYYNEEKLLESCNSKTRAILVPHLYGDIRFHFSLSQIQEKFPKVYIIEELSDCLGAVSEVGNPIGKGSSIALLYLSDHNIITTGNGAALITDNLRLINAWKSMRHTSIDRNMIKKMSSEELSKLDFFDFQMADFQAALALAQLKNLAKFNQRRQEIANLYRQVLAKTTHKFLSKEEQPVPHRFPVVLQVSPEDVIQRFRKRKVEIGYGTYYPLHRLFQMEDDLWRQADRLYNRVIELPLYPQLSKKEVDLVLEVLSSLPG